MYVRIVMQFFLVLWRLEVDTLPGDKGLKELFLD